jgi:AcrR family transcriptional regulator
MPQDTCCANKSNNRLICLHNKCTFAPSKMEHIQHDMMDNITCDKTDKRKALLEAAEQLFAQHGFEAVSVRHLALEAGVNVSMVSYYFGSKEGLFEELIASRFPYARGVLEALAADTMLSAWEKMSQTIDLYVDKFFGGRSFHRVIMREMSLQQRPALVKIITELMSKNMVLIRGFIVEGQEKGQFNQVDADFTIVMLFGAISAYLNNSTMVGKLLQETDDAQIFSDVNKARFKRELKVLFKAHLVRVSTDV